MFAPNKNICADHHTWYDSALRPIPNCPICDRPRIVIDGEAHIVPPYATGGELRPDIKAFPVPGGIAGYDAPEAYYATGGFPKLTNYSMTPAPCSNSDPFDWPERAEADFAEPPAVASIVNRYEPIYDNALEVLEIDKMLMCYLEGRRWQIWALPRKGFERNFELRKPGNAGYLSVRRLNGVLEGDGKYTLLRNMDEGIVLFEDLGHSFPSQPEYGPHGITINVDWIMDDTQDIIRKFRERSKLMAALNGPFGRFEGDR